MMTTDSQTDLLPSASAEETTWWRSEAIDWEPLASSAELVSLLHASSAGLPWVIIDRAGRQAQIVGGDPVGFVVELHLVGAGFRTLARRDELGEFITLPEHCRWWVSRARESELWYAETAADLAWAFLRSGEVPAHLETRPVRQLSNRTR